MDPARGRRRIPIAEWQPAGIDDLEPAAWHALRDAGSTSVSAGPGAGKTEFLAQRAAYLLQTGTCPAPQRVLAISFKRDSASNLARRVRARVPEHADRFHSMTFDAFTKGLLDRFGAALPTPWAMPSGRYELRFWNSGELKAEHAALLEAATPDQAAALWTFQPGRLLPDAVGAWPLPADVVTPPPGSDPGAIAAACWWSRSYLRPGVPSLEFTMINRLADLLVRHHARMIRALRATYPYVFVDEFQDTTAAQYTFLRDVFAVSGVVTTAVGDGKQKIMGWAGAMPFAMQQFDVDFGATRYELEWNFRSSSELVTLQHMVATELQPGVSPAVSKAQVELGHVPAVVWRFADSTKQAMFLAEWIANDIATSGRTAADFAFLAKQQVAGFEVELRDELGRHALSLRNDDAQFGELKLQNLVKHDVVRLIVGVLQLAVQPRGLPEVWIETLALLSRICGDDRGENEQRRTADRLTQFAHELGIWLGAMPIGSPKPRQVVDRAASIVEADVLDGFIRSQHAGEDAETALIALTARLDAVLAAGPPDWRSAVEGITASDAIALQTIHRSKGLEYHTVFVLGLDPDQWWSYRREREEATSAFFVALSRAAQRVIFTCTDPSARYGTTRALYELLDRAGVPEVQQD